MTALLREAWERFWLYFPLVLMGALALGTYWLVRSTPPAAAASVAMPPQHEPDYFMRDFSARTFDEAGRLRTEVMGSEARHYPDTLQLEIERVRIRSYDPQGRQTTASADRALTNEDATEVQLIGNALIVREADPSAGAQPSQRLEYRGEFLHAFLHTERVTSHKPVEWIRGKDRFTADRMDFDNVEQTLQLNGRVRGTLMPPVE
ncbi:MAG: LPS export ABC transporter periplasmic protein LptC [Rhodoferax sp.]|mgnify:FL=1